MVDADDEQWQALRDMPNSRYWHDMCIWGNKLIVAGGWTGSSAMNCVDVLDIETGEWQRSQPMLTARHGHRMCVCDGKVYVTGGYNSSYLNNLEVLDLRTMQWQVLQHMLKARCFHAMCVWDNKLYVSGGANGSQSNCIEVLDLATLQWQLLAPMLKARVHHAMCAWGNKLYVSGGASGSASNCIEVLDLVTLQWQLLAPMLKARYLHAMCVCDDKLFISGGVDGRASNSVDALDLVTQEWQESQPMLTARMYHAMCASEDTLYVTGGANGNYTTCGEMLKLDGCGTGGRPPRVRIPHDATLQQIADSHVARVAKFSQQRERALGKQTQICDDLRTRLSEEEQKLADMTQHYDAELARIQAEATQASEQAESFGHRVATNGLEALSVDEVFQLLHLLHVPVPKSLLQAQEISGVALIGLTEAEMQSVFKLNKLGERRKLSITLRRLSNRQGFAPDLDPAAPGALGWSVARVGEWLATEGFAKYADAFAEHAIDGPVLLELTRDDLGTVGITTIGAKAQLTAKLDTVKKQSYAGQVVGARAAGGAASVALTEAERRLVLEQVLDENDALREALEQRHPRREEMPDHFLCPITNEVMEDPVFAMDGFTYERQAITTWFQRHDTSPMTRAVIPPTLVPNIDKRSQIANFGDLTM